MSFAELTQMNYKEQAIWFLNGFWAEIKDDAEQLWTWQQHFVKLDKLGAEKKGEDGCELDQFWSAKFLEDMDKAITAKERKEALKEIDQDNNGKMALLEYCLWKYKKTPAQIETAPQGDNKALIAELQQRMDALQVSLDDVMSKLEAQKAALAECQAARADNEQKLAAQKIAVQESTSAVMKAQAATDALKAAEAELQAAVDALAAEEAAYKKKCDDLQAKIDNPATSGMQKAKATNELAQFKSEDPLPLRRAKITQEAALRKAQKAAKAAEAATAAAEEKKAALVEAERALEATAAELAAKEAALAEKKAEAEAKKADLEAKQAAAEAKEAELSAKKAEAEQKERELEAKKAEAEQKERELEAKQRELEKAVAELEVAYTELGKQMDEAQQALQEIKAKGGVAHGALFFQERHLFEADKYMPTSKQRYDHKKPFVYQE
eukprot:TRINITY_DN680_c0_g1_i6.p2 TRINITY_DN680_c0_g1~~TRINITY_DN680_c0_g1_i6.p2  ORF type:complete len:439 (-),score=220.63 TRINITY_DN680_c0_g1_i6:34-1350(-)